MPIYHNLSQNVSIPNVSPTHLSHQSHRSRGPTLAANDSPQKLVVTTLDQPMQEEGPHVRLASMPRQTNLASQLTPQCAQEPQLCK